MNQIRTSVMAAHSVQNFESSEILRSYGGLLNLPKPSDRHWSANIMKWLKRGLNIAFIEQVAKNNEGQAWNWSRRRTAKLLELQFGMETQWRLTMESAIQTMKYSIVFGVSGSEEWEATVTQCYKLGFNIEFAEKIERRQKHLPPWTWILRDRAKTLEWEFHRHLIIAKYTEGTGKSIARIVREMLEEKGVKLSPETLNKRLSEWGIPKRTKPSAYASTISTPRTGFLASTLPQPASTPSNSFANRLPPQSEFLPTTPALPSSKKCASFDPTYMRGSAAGLATGVDASTHHPVNGVEQFAPIKNGDIGTSTSGSTIVINRWDNSQFPTLQDADNGAFHTQLPPSEVCPNPDQRRNDSENSVRQRFNPSPHLGYLSSSLDVWVPRFPPSSLHEPSRDFYPGSARSANTSIDGSISDRFQTSTFTYTSNLPEVSGSDGNRNRKPDVDQIIAFPPGTTLEAKIHYLHVAIATKEKELVTIQNNYSTVARELADAKQELRVLSSDTGDPVFPVGTNQVDAHGISNWVPRRDEDWIRYEDKSS